jgi:hypothetical protein
MKNDKGKTKEWFNLKLKSGLKNTHQELSPEQIVVFVQKTDCHVCHRVYLSTYLKDKKGGICI